MQLLLLQHLRLLLLLYLLLLLLYLLLLLLQLLLLQQQLLLHQGTGVLPALMFIYSFSYWLPHTVRVEGYKFIFL